MDYNFEDGRHFAKTLDSNDILGLFRKRFYMKENTIYMCGNSLGLASKDAVEALFKVVNTWKNEGINFWQVEDCKYINYSNHLATIMANIVGAHPEEIAITGTTTVNIHQMISTFYKPTRNKYKILIDDINFPTDRYAIESQIKLLQLDPKDALKIVKSNNQIMNEDDIIDAMTEEIAIVFLPAVYYRTCQLLDLEKITLAAKKRGIFIGWDLCHAVGAVEVDLNFLDADFAVWCTYKYLNGGPGSAAALYINKKHFNKTPGLSGWYGNKPETRFKLKQEFEPAVNGGAFQIGTPNIFSMATLEESLKIFDEAGMSNIRKKSLNITAYLMFLIENKLSSYGFLIGNLKDDSRRGGHVCLRYVEAYRISLALKERGVLSDFREPNVIRLTPVALYTNYENVYEMVEILTDIMVKESYKALSDKRKLVV